MKTYDDLPDKELDLIIADRLGWQLTPKEDLIGRFGDWESADGEFMCTESGWCPTHNVRQAMESAEAMGYAFIVSGPFQDGRYGGEVIRKRKPKGHWEDRSEYAGRALCLSLLKAEDQKQEDRK